MEHCFVDKLKDQPSWLLVLFTIGSLSLLKFFFAFLKWVYVNFLRPAKNLKKYGSWALVTGPTDGIGKGFAFQLARKGMNLVLVGRNPDKLKDVSDSIQSKYGKVQIKSVVVDFSGDIDEGIRKIQETIEGLDVGVLINNVGVSYPYARFFHEVDEELLKNLIKVNVEGTTKVTKAVLPGMLKRKKGAIVNIGSGAAIVIPSDPLYAVYAATKAYIDQFSRCLYVEYKKSGIDVQCQVPRNEVLFQPAKKFLPAIQKIQTALEEKVVKIQGARIEDNRFCISVHFRQVREEDYETLEKDVKSVLEHYPEFHLSWGKKVMEIRPSIQWDKGDALEYLLDTLGLSNSNDVIPVYIGDDRTDEDAFKVIQRRGQGYPIIVSSSPKDTKASFSLHDPSEVLTFLLRLARWRKSSSSSSRSLAQIWGVSN